jgi:hypothetical protein
MVNDYLALEGLRLAERLHVPLNDGREIQISRRQARQFRELIAYCVFDKLATPWKRPPYFMIRHPNPAVLSIGSRSRHT